jgi:hypothetical protein
MMYVPLVHAQEILYKNGEMNPSLCELEVELHKQNSQSKGIYIGYFQSGDPVIETFADAKSGEKCLGELRESSNDTIEFVVVDSLKEGK